MGGLAVGKGKQKQPSWEPGHTAPAQTAGGEDSSGTSPGSSLGPARSRVREAKNQDQPLRFPEPNT